MSFFKVDASRTRRGAPESATVRPCVWALGGGKGGVGKSVITSSLAIAFAERGQRCAVVDADFGGANLHTMLGMRSPERTLSHFLKHEVASLAEVLSPTPIPNLWVVSGARSHLDIANLRHAEKLRLLRHLHNLDVEHVLLDLSAGSAFNALDFFLEARHAILTVVPEPTSIENAYHFLKAAFFRSLKRTVRQSPVRAAIHRVLDERATRRIRSPRELIALVSEIDADAGSALEERARAFAPLLIVNQARSPEHRSLGHDIRRACQSYLGRDVEYLGWTEHDDCVNDALTRGRPVLKLYPGCAFSLDLERIAKRLLGEVVRATPGVSTFTHRQSPALYDERYFASHGEVAREPHLGPEPARPALATPAAAGAAPGIARPGAHLRHWREQLGLDLSDLCHRTRILSLDSIENERFGQLPPEPYLRGFVLQYAQALGLSEGEALAASFVERYRRAMAHS